jgi:hypothetical protein
MERKYNKIIEDYLDIDEVTTFTTGVDKVRYIPINPVEGTTFTNGEKSIFSKSKSDA